MGKDKGLWVRAIQKRANELARLEAAVVEAAMRWYEKWETPGSSTAHLVNSCVALEKARHG